MYPVALHNHENPHYKNLIEDIVSDLSDSIKIAVSAGVKKEDVIIDPGIGFAKTVVENLVVMNHLESFIDMNCPILLGTSRKSMIGKTLDLPVEERLEGTIATTVLGYMKGCRLFRVHDVKDNLRALRMTEAIFKSS